MADLCACGCGNPIPANKSTRKNRRFVHGHNARGSRKPPVPRLPCACGCGTLASSGRRYVTGHNTATVPLEERFWRDVQKTDGCWLWTGARRPREGHGTLSYVRGGKTTTLNASRLAWLLLKGPIPKGLEVCHNCPGGDNPACVNPDHLWLGTRLEHIRDTARKKQYSRGAEHWMRARREQVPVGSATSNAKLNEEQVASIRRLYEGGGWQQKQLAAEFGVSEMAIHYIVHRRTWKHVA